MERNAAPPIPTRRRDGFFTELSKSSSLGSPTVQTFTQSPQSGWHVEGINFLFFSLCEITFTPNRLYNMVFYGEVSVAIKLFFADKTWSYSCFDEACRRRRAFCAPQGGKTMEPCGEPTLNKVDE
jgi:hypothetical protein